MLEFRADEITRICGGRLLCGPQEAGACRVVIDSRQAGPDTLFAAFPGEQVDGHNYVEACFDAGARIALITDATRSEELRAIAQRYNAALIQVEDMQGALWDLARANRARLSCPIIAITGSSGKTSTKELLASVLSQELRTEATRENHNNELGVPLTLLQADASTQVLVVEMGMRGAGEITALAELVRPQIGIITSIGLAHVEMLGSPEAVAAAKAELLTALPLDGLAIYPDDTGYTDLLREANAARRTLTVGSGPDADYYATDITLDDEGCALATIHTPHATFPAALHIPGLHMLSNALLVCACAEELGLTKPALVEGLAQARVVGSRGARLEAPGRGVAIIADAYNANPDSMAVALRSLASLRPTQPEGRRVAVLGDMLELGDRSQDAHRAILELADKLNLEFLFVFGSQFGAVAPAEIAYDDMVVLGRSLCAFVRPGDIVLVKGSRGMRMERVIEALQAEN